ncbi:hypothetical protein RR48_12330 [Papilio machaon]|uniref:Uncharacterized protein n=1 Tax=Papilio machaon TaxID=76193 RepID=A0A194QSY0_PAPMA|nr:hypothetical protein RR48_12330 [Papilio machaon]
MGCIFGTLGSAFSVILDALERISTWTVCAILTCCLAVTLITVLLIGIGIGYHYCYIHYVGSGSSKCFPTACDIRHTTNLFQFA